MHLSAFRRGCVNTKWLTFYPEIANAFIGLMTKVAGLQKHEHSLEIKTNCYFWTPSNRPSDVFSTNNLILDIFKRTG